MQAKKANYSIHDYVTENNASFDEQGFNNVDGAVLSQIANMNLDGMGLDINSGESLTIDELFRKMEKTPQFERMKEDDKKLLEEMAHSNRYKGMVVSNFVHDPVNNNVEGFPSVGKDKSKEQFAAVTITYEQNGKTVNYMSFRATDASLNGWYENFLMLKSDKTQAQADSVAYMNIVGRQLEGELVGGGHSKGGNDFEYGYLYCDEEVRRRFTAGYLYDSPGLRPELLENNENYERFLNIINGHFLCPQDSVVGQLLRENENAIFVHSAESGFFEHDLYSWEIDKDSSAFVPDSQSELSVYVNRLLDEALENLNPIERQAVFALVGFILMNTPKSDDFDQLIDYYTHWKNEDGSIDLKKIFETFELLIKDLIINNISYGPTLKIAVGKILAAILAVSAGVIIEKIEDWVEKTKERIKKAIETCISKIVEYTKAAINDIRAVFSDIYSSFVNAIESFKNWWNQNFNKGLRYSNANPYIDINTTNMHSYASRLRRLSSRAKTLDGNMNNLYLRAGFDWNVTSVMMNLGKLLRVGVILDFAYRLDSCANYLEETAREFDAVENEITGKI